MEESVGDHGQGIDAREVHRWYMGCIAYSTMVQASLQ